METPPSEKIIEWVKRTEWSAKEAEEFYYELRQSIEENNPDISDKELDEHAFRCTKLSVRHKRPPSEIEREKASRREIMDAKDPEATDWTVSCPSSSCQFSVKIKNPDKHVFCPQCGEKTWTEPIKRDKELTGDALEW